jgi:sugar-specific transcriptional regulator TrmB
MINSPKITEMDNDFLDAILHGGGMEVLSLLSMGSYTSTEVSKQLQLPLAKVNYITKSLMDFGLVYVDSTKSKEDLLELAYRADVNSFSIRLNSKNSDEIEKIKLMNYMIDEVKNGMIDAISGQAPAEFSLVKARIPREKVKEYIKILRELENTIDSHQDSKDDSYTFVVSLFPNKI